MELINHRQLNNNVNNKANFNVNNNVNSNDIWHTISCNWIYAVLLFLCCFLMNLNAASSGPLQHGNPVIQTLPKSNAQKLIKPQIQPLRPQSDPQSQPSRTPRKMDINGLNLG